MIMNRKFSLSFMAALMASFAFVSCGPASYYLQLESRRPSESGLDLSGKTLSVVYLESENGRDSLFNNRVADALAYGLENEFFDGQEAVGVYNLVKDAEGDYASRDTALQYIMLLDSDVVILLDTPESPEIEDGRLRPVTSKLYIYDSMAGKDDGVTSIQCSSNVTGLKDEGRAMAMGTALLKPLRSQWESEQLAVLYCGGSSKWTEGVILADQMEWPEAIKLWMELAKSKNRTQSSCARYNVALGCYVMGQYGLAKEWLDSSDEMQPLSVSTALRRRIEQKLGS